MSDPLVALWQTTPNHDTEPLLRAIHRQQQMHRRMGAVLAAILASVTILLASEEATGRMPSHGWITGVWLIVLLLVGARWYRAKRHQHAAATMDTVALLRAMTRQAGADLFLARCLWAGVPLGAALGWTAMRWLAPNAPPETTFSWFSQARTAAAIALLGAMILSGLVLERSRKSHLRDLTGKLRAIVSDL